MQMWQWNLTTQLMYTNKNVWKTILISLLDMQTISQHSPLILLLNKKRLKGNETMVALLFPFLSCHHFSVRGWLTQGSHMSENVIGLLGCAKNTVILLCSMPVLIEWDVWSLGCQQLSVIQVIWSLALTLCLTDLPWLVDSLEFHAHWAARNGEQTHCSYISAQGHAPQSCWIKHKLKTEIIKNFKMVTATHHRQV
jgi:hypothetical protein